MDSKTKDSRKTAELLCFSHYAVDVPPLPAAAKTLELPLEPDRLHRFVYPGLDKLLRPALLIDPFYAMPVDCIDPQAYDSADAGIAQEDLRLLRQPVDAAVAKAQLKDKGNKQFVAQSSQGMPLNFQAIKEQAKGAGRRPSFSAQPSLSLQDLVMDAEAAFAAASRDEDALLHSRNPSLSAMSVVPVLPAAHSRPFAAVSFARGGQPSGVATRLAELFMVHGAAVDARHASLYLGKRRMESEREGEEEEEEESARWTAEFTMAVGQTAAKRDKWVLAVDPQAGTAEMIAIDRRYALTKRQKVQGMSAVVEKEMDDFMDRVPATLRIKDKRLQAH